MIILIGIILYMCGYVFSCLCFTLLISSLSVRYDWHVDPGKCSILWFITLPYFVYIDSVFTETKEPVKIPKIIRKISE